jgi:transketolase
MPPCFLFFRTTIGFGSSKQGTEGVHGAPLGAADLATVKKFFGFNPEQSFIVPDEVSLKGRIGR